MWLHDFTIGEWNDIYSQNKLPLFCPQNNWPFSLVDFVVIRHFRSPSKWPNFSPEAGKKERLVQRKNGTIKHAETLLVLCESLENLNNLNKLTFSAGRFRACTT